MKDIRSTSVLPACCYYGVDLLMSCAATCYISKFASRRAGVVLVTLFNGHDDVDQVAG